MLPSDTPQAQVPESRCESDYIRDSVLAQSLNVNPPKLITAAGKALDDVEGIGIRKLQNCGITAAYYLIVEESKDINHALPSVPDATNFHGILAGGSAQDDGLGTEYDFSRFKGAVYVAAVSGNLRISTFVARGPEGANA
jgi:hypothetical protein